MQGSIDVLRHLEIIHVILSASFGSVRPASQILRCAQDDMQDTARGRSREIFSPNVYDVLAVLPWLFKLL